MPIATATHAHATGHNCCQAVLHAFGADQLRLAAAHTLGGGRAPAGRCGALHAACELSGVEQHEAIESSFVRHTGSAACREIRKLKKATCRECVAEAARLVQAHRQGTPS